MDNKPEPTQLENKAAEARIKALDHLSPACDWGNIAPGPEARKARERWNEIMAKQDEYEAKYF